MGMNVRPDRGAAEGSKAKMRRMRSLPMEARWVPVVGWNHFAWRLELELGYSAKLERIGISTYIFDVSVVSLEGVQKFQLTTV